MLCDTGTKGKGPWWPALLFSSRNEARRYGAPVRLLDSRGIVLKETAMRMAMWLGEGRFRGVLKWCRVKHVNCCLCRSGLVFIFACLCRGGGHSVKLTVSQTQLPDDDADVELEHGIFSL